MKHIKSGCGLIMILGTMSLASCNTTNTAGIDVLAYCDAYAPIRWSKKDTTLTVKQVKMANAIYDEKCGKSENPK
jgi:predicted small secreted protein